MRNDDDVGNAGGDGRDETRAIELQSACPPRPDHVPPRPFSASSLSLSRVSGARSEIRRTFYHSGQIAPPHSYVFSCMRISCAGTTELPDMKMSPRQRGRNSKLLTPVALFRDVLGMPDREGGP